MQPLFIWVICIIAISVIVIAMVRTRLKNKSKELAEKLNHISAYSEKSNYEQAKERLSALKEGAFIDIPSDLNNGFYGRVISATQEKDFINHYKVHFQEAYSLLKKLKAFNITPSETISKFINDFGRINKLVKQHNDGVITFLLDTHRDFFDHCLKYPLDKQQRRSIVSEEDNCLVVSSAGSGKTSSIVGKVKYLTEIKGIAPERILLISYTNKAAAELTERMATNGLKGYTFHKLAIDIIGKTTGTKPSICDNTDSLFVDIYHKLLDKSSFKKSIVEYFIDYQTNEADWEQRKNERREQLSGLKVDEHGLVPAWFAKDKGITYEEANQKYNDGITWKKTAHEKFGTQLLVTSSADFHYSDIRDKLRKLLAEAGVPIQEKTDEELYDLVLPKGSKQEKAFIRLVVTFVTLVKSSCKSVKEVLKQAKNADDERSVFIIKNIFQPVYERYINALSDSNQIDFTDAILQATEICRTSHPVEYDYIIVDEFQDISVDRYNFLKVLREGNPPAKLYCVGDDWQSIYRFSGSDMALFNQFPEYFGATEINKIETTYRFGEPLVSLSSNFIQRNKAQIQKNIHSFSSEMRTELEFYAYDRRDYCNTIGQLVASIPSDKSIFLLGRYSFDDYYLSFMYQSIKEGNRFYYVIGGRKIEFLTVHKSKGLEANYVILLQCNKDTYGFPSQVSDDPVLNYVLTKSDQFPYGEERRLFYVAITRAKIKTLVLYDKRFPSVFVDEFLHPEKVSEESYVKHPNANKRWTRSADQFLLKLHNEGKSVKYIANKMGRSQTSIVMRLNKLKK